MLGTKLISVVKEAQLTFPIMKFHMVMRLRLCPWNRHTALFSYPAGTRRNNNTFITSKRRRDIV